MLRLLLLSRRGLPLPSAPSSSAFGFRPFSTPAASPPPTPPPADGEAATKRKQAAPGQPSDRSHIPQGLNSTGKWMWVGTQDNKYKVRGERGVWCLCVCVWGGGVAMHSQPSFKLSN